MYEFVTLGTETSAPYSKLTYPHFRTQLLNLTANKTLVAVGVHLEGLPAGLVVGYHSLDGTFGEILSLFVVPEHRNNGLGTALLTYMEENLYRRGCEQVSLVYLSPSTTSPALEKILKQRHWLTPQPRMLVCLGMVASIKNAAWLQLDRKMPPSYTLFPWVQVTHQERDAIQRQQALSPWYPELLSPFKEEDIIEPLNSFGLRYKDEVVGWMITHRIAIDTLRYTSLFVRQDLQSNGRAIPMLATAINMQLNKPEIPKASFTVLVDNTPMVRFVQRRLASYLASIRQSMQASKLLGK